MTESRKVEKEYERTTESQDHLVKQIFFPKGAFKPGCMIVIVGTPRKNLKGRTSRFEFDFTEDVKGSHPSGMDHSHGHNIPFHFNPRFNENLVVRNNYLTDKKWQEPSERDGGMPFAYDKQFVCLMVCEPNNKIRVDINGKTFCTFGPRVPFDKVDCVEIYDAVELACAEFISP